MPAAGLGGVVEPVALGVTLTDPPVTSLTMTGAATGRHAWTAKGFSGCFPETGATSLGDGTDGTRTALPALPAAEAEGPADA